MTNLDSILKSRDVILPTKVRLVNAMVFPVVTYGFESWTIKKAEGRRIDAFELWCWRRLLRVPWTTRRSNQSIPKEIRIGMHLKLTVRTFVLKDCSSAGSTLSISGVIPEHPVRSSRLSQFCVIFSLHCITR